MKGRYLSALSALALVVACQDQRVPTAPARQAPTDPSALISDGAHGGNPDFFFLLQWCRTRQQSELRTRKSNVTLAPSLSVVICRLQARPWMRGLPVTDCVAGLPVKTSRRNSPTAGRRPDGFYQVLWHTQESTWTSPSITASRSWSRVRVRRLALLI